MREQNSCTEQHNTQRSDWLQSEELHDDLVIPLVTGSQ